MVVVIQNGCYKYWTSSYRRRRMKKNQTKVVNESPQTRVWAQSNVVHASVHPVMSRHVEKSPLGVFNLLEPSMVQVREILCPQDPSNGIHLWEMDVKSPGAIHFKLLSIVFLVLKMSTWKLTHVLFLTFCCDVTWFLTQLWRRHDVNLFGWFIWYPAVCFFLQ